MSRVAEALRKSRGEISKGGRSTAALGPAALDSEIASADPWSLSDPVPLPEPARDIPTMPTRDIVPAASLPASPVSDGELARLVQRIFRPAAGMKGVRSVLFAAVSEQAASTAICASVAQALAEQTAESICVVDLHARVPDRRLMYDNDIAAPAMAGRSHARDPDADAGAPATRIDRNLWLLPAGSDAAAPPHIQAEQLRVRLPQLCATFDYVLLDAPAGAIADVSLWGAVVDGVVLVVEADATRRDAATRVASQLRAANIRVLGAVLTNRTFPIPEAIYRRL
jgi:protein-tyrosine kinase